MPRALGVLFALLVAAAPSPASAQASDRERAESHFEAARRHVKVGRCDLAIEELRLAIDYEPTSVGARLNLGDCYVTLGRLPEAFRQFKEAEANALQRNDPRLSAARRSGAEIQAQLVRVLLREPEPVIGGLVVTVDGASAGTRPWLVAVTPGTSHALEARAPDGRRWRATVTGNAGETFRFDMDFAPPPPPPPPPPDSAPPRPNALPTVGVVAGAIGIAGIATGVVFGVLTVSSRSDLADAVNGDARCSGTYPSAHCSSGAEAHLRPIEDRAFFQSTVSTVSLTAGGVLLAGGIALYLLAPSSSRRQATLGSGVGGIAATF